MWLLFLWGDLSFFVYPFYNNIIIYTTNYSRGCVSGQLSRRAPSAEYPATAVQQITAAEDTWSRRKADKEAVGLITRRGRGEHNSSISLSNLTTFCSATLENYSRFCRRGVPQVEARPPSYLPSSLNRSLPIQSTQLNTNPSLFPP